MDSLLPGYTLRSGWVHVHRSCGGFADVCIFVNNSRQTSAHERVMFRRLLEESKSGKQALREASHDTGVFFSLFLIFKMRHDIHD